MAKALLRIRDSCGMRQASSLSLTKTRAANVPFLGTARIPVRSNDDRENFRGHCTCKQLLCTPLVSPPNGRYLYISTIKKQDRSIKIADRLVAVGYRSHTRSISDQSRSHFQGDVLDLDLEAFSFDDVPEKLGSKKTSVPAGDTAESARGERPDGKGTTSTVTETREREPIVPEDASHEKAPPQDPTENEESDWNDLTFSETDAPAEEYKAFEAEMRRAYGAGGTDNGDVSEDDQHDGEHEIWERVDWLPDRPDTELSDDIDELCYCYKKTVYHSHLLFVNGWDPRDQTSREVRFFTSSCFLNVSIVFFFPLFFWRKKRGNSRAHNCLSVSFCLRTPCPWPITTGGPGGNQRAPRVRRAGG